MADKQIIIDLVVNGQDKADKALDMLNNGTSKLKKGFIEGKKASLDMFKSIAKAAMKNPFTAIVMVIGTIILAIGKFVADTEQGMDMIKRAIAPIVGAFEAMKGIMQDLFLGNEVGDWTQRLKDGAKAQQEIERLAISIRNEETKLIELRSQTNQILKEQELIANDVSKSVEERRKASKAANEAATKLAEKDLALQDEKIRKMQLEQSTNETTSQQAQELATLIAERYDLEGRLTDVKLKYLGIDKSILDQEKAMVQAARDRAMALQGVDAVLTSDIYNRRLKTEKDYYKKADINRTKDLTAEYESEQTAIKNLAEKFNRKDILSKSDSDKSLKLLKETAKREEAELKNNALIEYNAAKFYEDRKDDKDMARNYAIALRRNKEANKKYQDKVKENKKSIEQEEELNKGITKIHRNAYLNRMSIDNTYTEEINKHDKDVNELFIKMTKDTEIAKTNDIIKYGQLRFEESQRLAKATHIKQMDDAGIVGEQRLELDKKFNDLQSAQTDRFNIEQEEKRKTIAESNKATAEQNAQRKLELLSNEHQLIREIQDEFTTSDAELSNEHYDESLLLLAEHRKAELDAVVGQKELIKAINEKYDKLDIKNSKDKLKAENNINAMRWNAKMGLVNDMANASQAMFAETAAGEKASLAVAKSAAIAQIWVSNAIANAKATASFPISFGQPFVGINTASAIVQTAGIIAQTAKGMSDISASHRSSSSSSKKGASGSNRYANGGIVKGAPTGDTVPIMANGGELMSNQLQKDNILLAIQNGQMGGNSFDYERLASLINDKKVYVLESDITEKQVEVVDREREFSN